MLSGKTVFVLGAGSSTSFGFPVGSKLLHEISRISNIYFESGYRAERSTDPKFAYIIRDLLRSGLIDNDSANKFTRVAQAAQSSASIDDFIHFENDESLSKYAKICIAYIISKYEQSSEFIKFGSYDYNFFTGGYINHWLSDLWKILNKGAQKGDSSELFKDCAFINFNYDRCIQWYLYHASILIYELDRHSAREFLNGVDIVHPYGNLGEPLQQNKRSNFGYDENHSPSSLFQKSTNILTYNEVIEQHVTQKIEDISTNAENIAFLGFGFHPQNMQILKNANLKASSNIFATMMGQPKFSQDKIIKEIRSNFIEYGADIHIHNEDCESFFESYNIGLTGYG